MVEDVGSTTATSSVPWKIEKLKVYQVAVKTRLTRSRNLSWAIAVFLANWLPLLI